ncbi:40S ribosomal protein S7-1 [Camellia lanceoleosa]|uniref:40S ribosomal protein S7-1 n=1 Tax=Camellia lanceoleosa TaxID=1840588 RepID=A0ACC0I1E6_9ERIC|nr:40S ribosomal protein S7-1 [Camellia lanceoleosa]
MLKPNGSDLIPHLSPLFAFTVRCIPQGRKSTKIRMQNQLNLRSQLHRPLFDLENTNQELKSELKDLYINSAVQIDVSGNRKAVVIHVPYRLRKVFQKIHVRLVRELEKKFSGKVVILIATRRTMTPPKKGSAVQRPRSRTLTYHLDGSKIMKVFLDPKERNNTEYKLETFASVYRRLSGGDVLFEYPLTAEAWKLGFTVPSFCPNLQ